MCCRAHKPYEVAEGKGYAYIDTNAKKIHERSAVYPK